MLLGNYAIDNANPGRRFSGITDPSRWYKGGSTMAFYYGDSSIPTVTDKSSYPNGYRPPSSFILAPKAGGLSSHKATTISFDDNALLVAGLPGSGSTTITFTQTATGGLIVSGEGSASITLSPTGTILSVAAGTGSATITLSGSALIGALAGLSATASITLTPTATINAIGYLEGLSTSETEFSANALAQAVWNALASDFNDAGTMGKLLNDASAAGNPWSALLASNVDPDSFGEFVQKLLTTGKFLALK